MKKIAITGGKGGTGKSTVSILLANKLAGSPANAAPYKNLTGTRLNKPSEKSSSLQGGKLRNQEKKVVLCDCDVECPNDFLLLGQKLTKPADKVYVNLPKLDETQCQKCGVCVENCRFNAIFQPRNGFPIFIDELCSGCCLCWNICPHGAITQRRKVVGEIFENKVDENFYLVTGKSVGVVEETGPIVSKTKEYALNLANRIKADYLLCDTSVGMHCGVIRAIIGSDFAYAVTEPTPLGAHDLKLILELLKELKVPAKVVLNQADLGKKGLIREVTKDFGLGIDLEIPYSRELVNAYSKGRLGSYEVKNLWG